MYLRDRSRARRPSVQHLLCVPYPSPGRATLGCAVAVRISQTVPSAMCSPFPSNAQLSLRRLNSPGALSFEGLALSFLTCGGAPCGPTRYGGRCGEMTRRPGLRCAPRSSIHTIDSRRPYAMEPASFAVGIVGLAGLFNSCLEALNRAKDDRSFETDSQRLNAQFEADRLRFERWGHDVGLESGRLSADHHELLDDEEIVSAVTGLLTSINKVCGPSLLEWFGTPLHSPYVTRIPSIYSVRRAIRGQTSDGSS